MGGETAAVAVGQTVGVFDATLGTYRVFERLKAAPLASGVLSSLAGRLRGADWLELSVFFNGDGTLNMDELGPDAVGLLYRGRRARLGVGDRRRPRRASPLNNAHRTKSFTALKATAASAGLVGFEDAGFVFTVRDIVVEVNSGVRRCCRARWRRRSIGAVVPADPNDPGDRVGYEVETGDPDNPVLIDFRGTPLVGFAAAHVVLEIGDNVFVSGAFSFRMGEVETVTVGAGRGCCRTSPSCNVKTIKIGAEGVSVFLGDGLADYDIDADIADYLSTDTPAQVLPGETVGNLVDGKIYRLRRGGAELARPDRRVWRPGLLGRVGLAAGGGRSSWVARRRRSRSGRRSGSSTRRWAPTGSSSGRAAPLASGVLSSLAGRLRGRRLGRAVGVLQR